MLKEKSLCFSFPATFDFTSDTRCVGPPPPRSSGKGWCPMRFDTHTVCLETGWVLQVKAPYRTGLTSDPTQESRLSHGYRLEPLLGFHGLLEQLSELWKAASLLDHEFIIKGYNLGTARWKRPSGRGVGKGWGASMLSPDHHPHSISRCSPTWKVSEPSLVGFLWRPKHD